MVSRLLLGIFAGLCLLEFSEGARFRNCNNNSTYIESTDSLFLDCFVQNTSTVRWTLVTKTGATLHLGTCYGPDNCTNFYTSSHIYILHYQTLRAQAQFYKPAPQFSGVLTCHETLTNGNVLSDTCQLNFARVSIASTYKPFDVRENDSRFVYCYHDKYIPSTVTWSLTTNSGQTLALGTCSDDGNCTSPHAPDITLERSPRYRSKIYFNTIDRSKGGLLFCSYTYNGSTDRDQTIMTVYNDRPSIRNCRAELQLQNWSTILSCNISDVFTSSEDYDFTVYQYFQVLSQAQLTEANSYVFDGRLSYRDMLTPYTNSTNNKVYYRGRLTHSWPLSPIPGIYTRLKLYVYYGMHPNRDATMDYRINISTPSQPTHNCSELNYIPETGEVPCVCTADSLGSPAGRILLLLGNVTIATGDYGGSQLKFPSGQVSRQHDGMMVTCQLDWLQPITRAFTTYLAYGPDSVTLQEIQSRDVSNNTLITVSSHVADMKPMTSDMVRWGGLCQGQQGFTCTLTPRTAEEVDGKTVTCRVTNAANNGHSAEASVVINIVGFTQSQTKRDGFNGTAVGLGIVLGIVVIAFVVVMIVLYRRGRLCNRPTQNAPTSQDDEDSHIYTGLKLSKVKKNKRKGAQQGVTCPPAVYQGDGDTVYENTVMGEQGGHM